MLGAIIGDIAGSRFEWENRKSKEFWMFAPQCRPTDDSIMTLAVAQAIMVSDSMDTLSGNTVKWMQKLGRMYPHAGYGGRFFDWLLSAQPQPYNSWGNGAAMRVSPCGFAAESLEEAQKMARTVTEVTHNHPEGIKAAEAVSSAIFLALHGSSMQEMRDFITKNYYEIDFTIDGIRDSYRFDVSCQGSVPQAFEAFFESTGFEDAIRNAISIGGDSDTIGAITGGMAEAYYGIPENLQEEALVYLDADQKKILNAFEQRYGWKEG